jgi:hypothetical protein
MSEWPIVLSDLRARRMVGTAGNLARAACGGRRRSAWEARRMLREILAGADRKTLARIVVDGCGYERPQQIVHDLAAEELWRRSSAS